MWCGEPGRGTVKPKVLYAEAGRRCDEGRGAAWCNGMRTATLWGCDEGVWEVGG